MSANPIDWISGLLGVEPAILWQKLIQLAAIWLIGWFKFGQGLHCRVLHLI